MMPRNVQPWLVIQSNSGRVPKTVMRTVVVTMVRVASPPRSLSMAAIIRQLAMKNRTNQSGPKRMKMGIHVNMLFDGF